MTLLVLLGWLVETMIAALIRAEDVGARFSVALADEIRVQWPLGAGGRRLGHHHGVRRRGHGPGRAGGVPRPLLVTQLAFRRYAGIRATYLQTVRSLARVTEVAGYVESGHSRRVSRLAVAVGRELGMPERDLLNLEYAALMHDIGQLSLLEPIPGGATVLVSTGRPGADRRARRGRHPPGRRARGGRGLVRCQSWPATGHEPAAARQPDHPGREHVRRPGRRVGRPGAIGGGAGPDAAGPARSTTPAWWPR